MDAHTYYARGGVFANVQTGQRDLRRHRHLRAQVGAALAHVWPILAFMAGVALAAHIKSGRVERIVPHPLRWTMAVQAVALAVIGFVPASVPHSYVTVPIRSSPRCRWACSATSANWSTCPSPRPAT